MRAKDFLSIDQLTADELARLLSLATDLKRAPLSARGSLAGRRIALVFQKPSLRTRASFWAAALELGAECAYLSPEEVGLGVRESVPDVARVLSRFVHAVVARTFLHEAVEELATHATIPVINGLSDKSHPCQILADLLTMKERLGAVEGLTVAYLGDGNNVTRSLVEATPLAGFRLRVATPLGYETDADAVQAARQAGGIVEELHDAQLAVQGADVVYTDTWVSMGEEAKHEARAEVFPPFRVNAELMASAPRHAIVMHCLPAHRGEEISQEVIDGPQSVVFDQAENRLHAQKALLAELLGGEP